MADERMAIKSGNLEVSKTTISFPLDSVGSASNSTTITLQHDGKIDEGIAFEVTGVGLNRAHPITGVDTCIGAGVNQHNAFGVTGGNTNIGASENNSNVRDKDLKYTVQPNKGVLSPNSSITLTIIMNDNACKRLRMIYELLGKGAVDVDAEGLLIKNSIITSTTAGAKVNDGGCGFWDGGFGGSIAAANTDNITIKINNYTSSDDDLSGTVSRGWGAPETEIVRSILDEIKNRSKPCWVKFALVLNASLATLCTCFASFYIGALPLFMGLFSTMYMIIDRGEFVRDLQDFDQNSIIIEGKVVKRHKKIDEVLDKEYYYIRVEYEGADETSVHTCVANYSSEIAAHGGKELYQLTESTLVVPMKILPNIPSSAIPVFLFDKKLKASLLWARVMHPLRATLGILVYLGMGSLWLVIDAFPAYIVLSCLFGGIILMIPLVLPQVKDRIEVKRRLVQREPVSIPTETDVYQYLLSSTLGPSPSRRIKFGMAIIGSFFCAVMSPMMFILLFAFGFGPLIKLSSSSSWRKSLRKFEEDSVRIIGNITSHRSSINEGTTSYYGTIAYELSRFGNVYMFEKEFRSELLFRNVRKRIHVAIHPDHPRSGHPECIQRKMISAESCSSKCKMHLSIVISFGLYFLGHWLVYGFTSGANGETDPIGVSITMWIVTCIAPIIVIPQLVVWGKKDHIYNQDQLTNGAKVVKCRKGLGILLQARASRRFVENSQQSISKGIGLESNEESNSVNTSMTFADLDEDTEDGRFSSLELV